MFYFTCNHGVSPALTSAGFEDVNSLIKSGGGVPWWRPRRRQELATLPSVGANPYSPQFPYVDLETRGLAVFLCFLVYISVKVARVAVFGFFVFGFY